MKKKILKQWISDLQEENDSLENQVIHLIEENKNLKNKCEHLLEENFFYQNKLADLDSEIIELRAALAEVLADEKSEVIMLESALNNRDRELTESRIEFQEAYDLIEKMFERIQSFLGG